MATVDWTSLDPPTRAYFKSRSTVLPILALVLLGGCAAGRPGSPVAPVQTAESANTTSVSSPPLASAKQDEKRPEGPSNARIPTVCPGIGRPTRATGLIGTSYDNAAASLPGGLLMQMEAALGDQRSVWSVVAATRGPLLVLLVSRMTREDPPAYQVVDALEIASVCPGLAVEARTCDLDGKPDLDVFALMDESYSCGGHGDSSPALAWRLAKGVVQAVQPSRVTCGSLSCEVDR